LMFLLLLMGLGTANVNAQVRIGGNTPPNPAAALDLNAAEGTTTGTKGLALPRVTLSSNTATLNGTTANITGMLVYNTSGSLSTGVYYWSGTNWNRAVASPNGLVDTTMLAHVPAGSLLIATTSGWRTANFDTIYRPTITIPSGASVASGTFETTACLTPFNVKPLIGSGPNVLNFTWWVNPGPPRSIVVSNATTAQISVAFDVTCLTLR